MLKESSINFLTSCAILFTTAWLDKKLADEKEEAICSAMSLCCLKYFGKNIDGWNNHVKSLEREGYRNGYFEALSVDFDVLKLSHKIIDNFEKQAI